MRNIFNLDFPIGKWTTHGPSTAIEKHLTRLMEISDFKKKMRYYNDHIYSLANKLDSRGLHSMGEYFEGMGAIIFKVGKSTSTEEQIFLTERKREISRLKKMIDSQSSYEKKLKAFIEDKAGQIRIETLDVITNEWLLFLANGGGVVPDHLAGDNIAISVEPQSPDEIEIYNLYLEKHVNRLIETPEQFHRTSIREYSGFLSGPAITAFSDQIEKAIYRESTVADELMRIESKFQRGRIPAYATLIYRRYNTNGEQWQAALFNALINGLEYDYRREKLSVDDMEQFT